MLIRNARVVLPDRVLERGSILVEGASIRAIGPEGALQLPAGDSEVDAQGLFVGPGFIDVHCHGDGMQRFFDDPQNVVTNLLRQGTTTVLATLGYPDMLADRIGEQLNRFRDAIRSIAPRVVAGVHLEGPYVNSRYGAQISRGVIKSCDAREYSALLGEFPDWIRWWTCAPELPGASEFIRAAARNGVVVAAGHTEATLEQVEAAIRDGLRVITHWTNATGNVARGSAGTRRPGIDEAALVFDELAAEIIADRKGMHVHPLMARLLLKAKGSDGILIITDAGYRRDDDPTDPESLGGDVAIDGEGNLAGSRLSMAAAARNFRAFTGCSWSELFRMASLNPARLLRMDHEVGSVVTGRLANLVMFDEQLRVRATFLHGRPFGHGELADPSSTLLRHPGKASAAEA